MLLWCGWVFLAKASNCDRLPVFRLECMPCTGSDTGHQYLEENSQLLARREQLETMAPAEEQGLCHWLLIPRAKHLFLKQQLLHPSLELANPALDPGRENPAVH